MKNVLRQNKNVKVIFLLPLSYIDKCNKICSSKDVINATIFFIQHPLSLFDAYFSIKISPEIVYFHFFIKRDFQLLFIVQ